MNFFKKGTIRKEKEDFQDSIKEALEKVIDIKKDIKKIEDNIAFLNEQKYSTISKVPESFFNQIEDLIVSNEKVIATEIFNDLLNNNVPGFMLKVNDYTSLNPEDITNNIKTNLKDENSKISEFINAKTTEKKNKQNEVMYMKKVSNFSLTIIAIEIFVSVLSIIVLIRNFSNINKEAFIVAMIAGVISTLSYNIDTGRHNSIRETTSDNLFSSIFNASLVYDLIYLSYMSKLEFAYGFIEMPIIFILLFIGFTSVISLLKYNNLMKKLRG